MVRPKEAPDLSEAYEPLLSRQGVSGESRGSAAVHADLLVHTPASIAACASLCIMECNGKMARDLCV